MANLKLIDRRGICWLGFLSALVLILMTASINIAQAVVTVDTYTTAGRPAAGTNGRLIRTTDDVRGLWMDTGSLWFSLSGEVVNVKEFGAKGDGTTDDYTAIQNAIDYASYIDSGLNSRRAFPTKVYFPPGVYKVETHLHVGPDSYITLEGAGKANTLIYNPTVNDVEGALLVDGSDNSTLSGGGTYYELSNKPGTTIANLGFGSLGGPALKLYRACNVWVRNVFLFSAGSSSAFLEIDGGGGNLYENVQADWGNFAIPGSAPYGGTRTGYYALIPSLNSGINSIRIRSTDSTPSRVGEQSFVNLRTGGGCTQEIVSIDAPSSSLVPSVKFTNAYIRVLAGYAGIRVNGGDVTMSNSSIEGDFVEVQPDCVYLESSHGSVNFTANEVFSTAGPLHLNKTSCSMNVRVDSSRLYNVKVEANTNPTMLQVTSTILEVAPSGDITNSNVLTWLGNTTLSGGGPYIGSGGSGEGFSSPNAVFTIAGDANGRAFTPVLSLNRLYSGQESKWNIGVNSDKALTFVDATNLRYPIRFNLGAPTDSLNLSSTGQLGIGTASQTAMLDINGSTGYNQLRMRTTYTPTGNSDANGNVGDVAWDSGYIYVKTNAGWKRLAVGMW